MIQPPPRGDDSRNMMLAFVLAAGVLILWWLIFPNSVAPRPQPAQQNPQTQTAAPVAPGASAAGFTHVTRAEALAQDAGRVPVMSNAVDGSIRLRGARFDDLNLKRYRETLDPGSPEINLLQPVGVKNPFYAAFGWTADPGANLRLPDDNTPWELVEGRQLGPGAPVVLRWDNGEGLVFTRRIELDENYLTTVHDSVLNRGGAAVKLYPYGLIARAGVPKTSNIWVVHEGMIGVFNKKLSEVDYSEIVEERTRSQETTGGWLGFTDHYWMVALATDQKEAVTAKFQASNAGGWELLTSDFLYKTAREIAPGGSGEATHYLFAGAKVVSVVDAYAENPGIERFDLAVDWGWFFFLTKPIFQALEFFFHLFGNFGVAILVLTVAIKLLFFPLANRSYEAMTKMKKLQPQMTELRERLKDDPQKQQQEMLALYKREKVNPVSGCLPMLLQIPVFFSLYKVLYVAIEMRHAPFFGWIRDLSAPDPTSIFNLFGLLPYAVPAILLLGVWPIFNAIVMWVQMKMNPPAPDPVQQRIFSMMPWIFMFMLAAFPVGLVIYWAWNGLLSVLQQYVIMRRMNVEIHLFDNLKQSWPWKLLQRPKPDAQA